MASPGSKRIAVIGAGPIGLEAALYGRRLGHDVQVYERGRAGENVRRWGFVTLFSPWHMNVSRLGLEQVTGDLPAPEACLTGAEHARRYLEPLLRSELLAERVHERCEIVHIGREGVSKNRPLGDGRGGRSFRLLLRSSGGEERVTADVVLDCSGTYGRHNWIGDGGIPALGELIWRHRIGYVLEDITGSARARYEGRHTMLIGTGHSAGAALDGLLQLPGTRVTWVGRGDDRVPFTPQSEDPLPERARLENRCNALARGEDPRVSYLRDAAIEAIDGRGEQFRISLRSAERTREVEVDRILAHVGYRPDHEIHRELQVHPCYATEGSMKLAAALLADGGGDCLAQTSKGPDTLRHPEPDFYILGAKSYGRHPNFLIRLGLEQVRDTFALIEGRPELNLYAA
jgi:thioredoxin reductase